MLGALVSFALRFRGLVVMGALVLIAYGAYRLAFAGLDIFPEFSPKAVVIQTESPGLTSEQVELLVTVPIEQGLAGLIGLQYVRAESIESLSIVTAVFDDDTSLLQNRQAVTERISALQSKLPVGITPTVLPLSSSSATVRTIGVQAADDDLMRLRDLVDTTLVPNLLSVSGVADVNVFGGDERSVQIQFRPADLTRFGVTPLALREVLSGALQSGVPLGAIENDNQRLAVQLDDRALTLEQIADLVVLADGARRVTVADVADVRYAPLPAVGAAQIGGKPAIVLMIIAQYGANTLTVSERLGEVLAGFEKTFARRGITLYPELFVPANYIETSLTNIRGHLMIGAGFVLLILVLFLYDLRAALVSAAAIPLSLLTAALILLEAGMNLNIMVLGGLAIALGEVVDDAIIDTENIYRRLRENQAQSSPREHWRVILDASLEVRGSVVYASFIVALAFVPLLRLSGVAGRLFAPLGITYICAILASLAVAVTITPALCAMLLGRRAGQHSEPPSTRWLIPFYAAGLRAVCARPQVAVTAAFLVCVGVLAVLPTFGSQFLPPLREGHYIMHTTGLPGTSLTESLRLGARLTAEIGALTGVRSVSQWAGRAERGADTYGTHYSEYEVALEPLNGAGQQAVLARIRKILATFPGLRAEINTFLTERVDETISGYAAPVVVNIFGPDFVALDRVAQQVAARMRVLPGAAAVQLRAEAQVPQIKLTPRADEMRHHGVTLGALHETVQMALGGITLGTLIDGGRAIPAVLSGPPTLRHQLANLASVPIAASGHQVPLGEVADFEQVAARYNVLHRNGQRMQSVTAQVEGIPLSDYVAALARELTTIDVPPEMRLELTGAAFEQAQARRELLLNALLVGAAILALIVVALKRMRLALLVLLNLPFALAGGVVAVVVTGATLSIGSVVGFVTLFGITVRNSIMLISHYQHLLAVEHARWELATVVRGASERLPSIAMTALVTALAMLPIALDSDNPGREIMGPMATIIIGGLMSSALLNLWVMPAVIWRWGRLDRFYLSAGAHTPSQSAAGGDR